MNVLKYLQFIFILILVTSCGHQTNSAHTEEVTDSLTIERNKEAREDSLKMAEAISMQAKFKNIVKADFETPPVKSALGDDAADDPAIWINKRDHSKSLIIGTNKKAGLHVYDIHGKELQFLPVGKINNAEACYDFKLGHSLIDIVGGTNRSSQTIDIYEIDRVGLRVKEKPLCKIPSTVDDVYGFCMFHDKSNNQHFAFANGKNGIVEQWQLIGQKDTVIAKLVRTLQMPSQPEGMVVDTVTNELYVGVEEDAIYKFSALADGDTTGYKIEQSTVYANPNIDYDIEGLSIYRTSEEDGFLIASIQGNFSYAIFDINEPHEYITSFVIADGKYDGVEETDGLEICSTPLGADFPAGILVVQDGFNKDLQKDENQNFKIISAEKVLKFLNKK